MRIPFFKTQTIGNDFVLVRASDVEGVDYSELAQATACRHFSVGHDGLLVVEPGDGHLKVRFFNPDGSEDFCGNGIRSAGLFAFVEGWFGNEFEIHQLGKVIPIRVEDGLVTSIMPGATLEPSLVPVCAEGPFEDREVAGVTGTAVSTGSTHFVTFTEALPETPWFERTGAAVEVDPVFPQKTSVIWTRVVSGDALEIRIWERGVGETLGCGTGAIAAAVIHSKKTGQTGAISVKSPGGELTVKVDRWDAPVSVSSRPRRVFEGVFEL